MKYLKYAIKVLFILISSLTISGSLKSSEEDNTTYKDSELDSFLDRYGFETVNSQNEGGELPLQIALEFKNYQAAEMLIEAGANADILYILGNNHAGLFEFGMTKEDVEELLKLYGEVEIEEVDLMTEGMSAPVLELTFENETSKTLILRLSTTDFIIYSISIYSDKFSTEEGIGIGSTYDDLDNNYEFEDVFWGEAGEPFIIVEEISMSFTIEPGDWWQVGAVIGDIPGNAEVIGIFTW